MPELPEVEIIKRALERNLVGKKIRDIAVLRVSQLTNINPTNLQNELVGSEICQIVRKGKYLLFHFTCERVLVIHLRMTGQLVYYISPREPDSYTRMILVFDTNEQLHLRDVRALARVSLLRANELSNWGPVAKLGPEPLSKSFTASVLQKGLLNRRTAIKNVLLDQKVVAGLGNIYADEALFKAKISPLRSASTLSETEILSLVKNIKEVLLKAISYGGTSFRDFVNAYGLKGVNQDHLFVYGRKGKNCCQCNTLLEGVKLNGRSTVFCPRCQPL